MKRNGKQVSWSFRDVPYEGLVGAGRLVPFPMPKRTTLEIPVPDYIPESETLGTMTVSGDSLERVGIFDGDVVLCRKIFQKRQIKPDTICIVYTPATGEVNAKKLRFEGNMAVLRYCGRRQRSDIYLPQDEVEIRGIVVSVTRQQREWPFIDLLQEEIPI